MRVVQKVSGHVHFFLLNNDDNSRNVGKKNLLKTIIHVLKFIFFWWTIVAFLHTLGHGFIIQKVEVYFIKSYLANQIQLIDMKV
jgi:hypothetical protein